MDFITDFQLLIDWKDIHCNATLDIVDWLTKIVYYKVFKTTINVSRLAKVIINVVIRHHGLLESIISDHSSLFTSKFWYLLYYLFDIKHRLSTTFYL